MNTYVQKLNSAVANMNEKQLNIVLDFIKDMLSRTNIKTTINTYKYEYPSNYAGGVKIGLFKDEKLLSDNYDFDECNDKIATMFGV